MRSVFFLAAVFLLSATAHSADSNTLKLMSDAYVNLKSLSVSGTIDFSADIDGQTANRHAEFTDLFVAPMRFRHEIKGDVIAAETADKVFVFLPEQNVYTETDAPVERGSFSELPGDLRALLRSQDLSLAFALAEHPSEVLIAGAENITQGSAMVDGQAAPSITVALANQDVTVILDPATHLVRRVVSDPSRGLRRRGADVKSASITINYTHIEPNAKITEDQLAFTPPATAQESESAPADAAGLISKAAPHFHLATLDGGEVSDTDLKGHVYVLEFWATTSGPCMLSLVGLDELAKEFKADGVKIFAVNQKEQPEQIKDFMGRLKVTLPVLLDADGKASVNFGVGDLPQAVVVGADGAVINIFVGPSQEQDIAATIQDAVDHVKTAAQRP